MPLEPLDIKIYEMKKINIGILVLIITCMFSCKDIDDGFKISSKINSVITENNSIYKALTYGYKFKVYKDGIGKDLSEPILNDSIIILKDDFTKNIKTSKINNGKSILIDSIAICKLSHKYDQEKQIMRSFLKISPKIGANEINIEIKNWVPQYTENGYICIELLND